MDFERGPWKIENRSGGIVRIGTEQCPAFMAIGGRGALHAFANGIRIVAALNACEGVLTTELLRVAKGWKSDVAEAVRTSPALSMSDTAAAIRRIDGMARDAGVPEALLGSFWEWLSIVKLMQRADVLTPEVIDEVIARIETLAREFLEMFRSDVEIQPLEA